MELLVDVQGFTGAFNEFIVKELAFISLTKVEDGQEKMPIVKFFQPPTYFCETSLQKNRTNTWLQRNYHGIPWNYGALEYDRVGDILQTEMKSVSKIYVKGWQKKEWLKQFFVKELLPVIVNLEECFEDCPSISNFTNCSSSSSSYICPYHCNTKNKVCAAKNVVLLKKWLTKKIIRSADRSIRIYYELGNLSLMNIEDVAYLPHSFISTFAAHEVEGAWEKLTDKMKIDPEIIANRYCFKHYNTLGGDCIDGPPPTKKNCRMCNKE